MKREMILFTHSCRQCKMQREINTSNTHDNNCLQLTTIHRNKQDNKNHVFVFYILLNLSMGLYFQIRGDIIARDMKQILLHENVHNTPVYTSQGQLCTLGYVLSSPSYLIFVYGLVLCSRYR
uniref:Uncharacterized protein n=1 Tax=Cacopsylla melanoneura TaxID=428564 RepID=A0A8D8RCG4_9HEMI